MDIETFVAPRVRTAFRDEEIHCTPTMLRTLGELFSVEIHEQVYFAASGMHGAGLYGAQCGLVEGALMFIGILGRRNGLSIDDVEALCCDFAMRFEKYFGSLLCREIRPEGFKDENPPHICEPRAVDAVVFAAGFISEKFNLKL